MANIISAGNTTNGLAISADTTGALDIKTGSGTGTTAISISSAQVVTMNGGVVYPLNSSTAVATTSGTSVDFTGLPSWVKRITVSFNAVVTSSSSPIIIQLGDSGGIETTGYTGAGCNMSSGPTFGGTANTVGFNLMSSAASGGYDGAAVIALQDTLTWVLASNLVRDQSSFSVGGGNKATTATLDRIRITTVNGTDTFTGGSINILYE